MEVGDDDQLPVWAERAREIVAERIVLVLFHISGVEQLALAAAVEQRQRRDTRIAIGRDADDQPRFAGDAGLREFESAELQLVRAFIGESAILLDRPQRSVQSCE